MKSIPVDPGLTFVAAGPAAPATTESGEPRLSKEGKPLFNVPVISLAADGTAEPFTVRVPGPIPTIAPLTQLRLPGLVARAWSMPATGRSGVSFSAAAVELAK